VSHIVVTSTVYIHVYVYHCILECVYTATMITTFVEAINIRLHLEKNYIHFFCVFIGIKYKLF